MVTLYATVDRINERASQVDWRRALLVLLLAIPYVLGYGARLIVRTSGWVLAWLWAACVEGWQAGSKRGSP